MASPQIPNPQEVVGALASFPPKLSVLAKPLTVPEDMFESMVRQATGAEIPPGPAKVAVQFMESFESGAPALTLPSPPAPGTQATQQAPPAPQPARGVRPDVEVF